MWEKVKNVWWLQAILNSWIKKSTIIKTVIDLCQPSYDFSLSFLLIVVEFRHKMRKVQLVVTAFYVAFLLQVCNCSTLKNLEEFESSTDTSELPATEIYSLEVIDEPSTEVLKSGETLEAIPENGHFFLLKMTIEEPWNEDLFNKSSDDFKTLAKRLGSELTDLVRIKSLSFKKFAADRLLLKELKCFVFKKVKIFMRHFFHVYFPFIRLTIPSKPQKSMWPIFICTKFGQAKLKWLTWLLWWLPK